MAAKHTTGHSIWLIPDPPEFYEYQRLINDLSLRTSTSVFSPHVTLLGQLPHDLEWLTAQFTTFFQQQPCLHIELHRMELQDQYFRSVILNVVPNPELHRLHTQALVGFRAEKIQPFLPHLSLLYSDLTLSTKKALIDSCETTFTSNVSLSEVHLVDTSGSPDQWQVVLKARLGTT